MRGAKRSFSNLQHDNSKPNTCRADRIIAALVALASVLAEDECENIEDVAARLDAYDHIANDNELMRLADRADRAR